MNTLPGTGARGDISSRAGPVDGARGTEYLCGTRLLRSWPCRAASHVDPAHCAPVGHAIPQVGRGGRDLPASGSRRGSGLLPFCAPRPGAGREYCVKIRRAAHRPVHRFFYHIRAAAWRLARPGTRAGPDWRPLALLEPRHIRTACNQGAAGPLWVPSRQSPLTGSPAPPATRTDSSGWCSTLTRRGPRQAPLSHPLRPIHARDRLHPPPAHPPPTPCTHPAPTLAWCVVPALDRPPRDARRRHIAGLATLRFLLSSSSESSSHQQHHAPWRG